MSEIQSEQKPEGAPEVVIVVAVAKNGVIGADNALPWRLSSDLRHFKAMTFGKPVVMGRKTFESLGRPLPGRPNIVVTRKPEMAPEGAEAQGSLSEALALAAKRAAEIGAGEIAIIGGGQIYREAMEIADRLEITEVSASPEGDTHFPEIKASVWEEVRREAGERGPKDNAEFAFVTYRRKASPSASN